MSSLLSSLGLNPMADYRGRSRRLPFSPVNFSRAQSREPILDSDNPFAPALQSLDNLVRTYQQQRQESVVMDAVADALATELSRYAERGVLPERYVREFANFNSKPLNQKRALVAQGMFLLGQNQEREEFETEQGRRNFQAFGSLISRLMSQADAFLRHRAAEAESRRKAEDQKREEQVVASLLESAGIKLPESAGGRISPETARLAVSLMRGTSADEPLDEKDATHQAAQLNLRLKGTGRKAVPMPVDKGRWKVVIIPDKAMSAGPDPRQFDVNRNNVLDPEEYAQYLMARSMGQIAGGVYPGMDLSTWSQEAVMPDEDALRQLLEQIDPSKLLKP